MLDNLNKFDVILASSSPRRKELLQRLGIDFKVRTLLGIVESYPAELKGEEIAKFIARKKAYDYRESMLPSELIITADTLVTLNGEELGKPHSVEDAKDMLHKLSGQVHEVSTGVCVFTKERLENFVTTSKVTFAELSEDEIEFYVEKYLPLDKAGAYGIQDWIGLAAVSSLEGSYYNVMGLPMQRLYSCLKTF